MSDKATSTMFFQAMFEIFESLPPERRNIVIKQLMVFGRFSEFLEFLTSKLESSNFPPASAKALIDLISSFMFQYKDSFESSNMSEYVTFLMKLISLKTAPSSYDSYMAFLRLSFELTKSHDQESMFKKITSMPGECAVIPVSAFSVLNEEFVVRAFRYVVGQIDPLFKSQKGIVWVLGFTLLLTSQEKVELDKTHVFSVFNTAFGSPSISIARKITMLDNACRFFDEEIALGLAKAHYQTLITGITAASVVEDVAHAINLAKNVLKLVRAAPVDADLDQKKVFDSIFVYLVAFYRPVKVINDALTEFCAEVEKAEIEELISSNVHSGMSNVCALFLISRYPTQGTLPFLFAKRAPAEQKTQYVSVFYYLSHNLVPFKFLPRLFELLEPRNLQFLTDIFEQKPELYCAAAVKFLAHCTTVEKVEIISELITGTATLPLISSSFCQAAFAVVSVLRAYSKQNPKYTRVLLDYLHACVIYSDKDGVKQESEKIPDKEILMLTNEEVEALRTRKGEDVFDVAQSMERVSAQGYCQAKVIHDCCNSKEGLSHWYTQFALSRIQAGEVYYTILVACLSQDSDLIHNCVETIRSDTYLLVFFFSSLICCSFDEGLTALKSYLLHDPNTQASPYVGQWFTSSPTKTKDNISDRQKVTRRVIISVAPFVPCHDQILEALMMTIPDEASNRTYLVCESIEAVCDRVPQRENLNTMIGKMLSQYDHYTVKHFVDTLSAMIKGSESLSEPLLSQICEVWTKLLLTNEVSDDCKFEQVLFDPYYKGVAVIPYLRALQKALLQNSDCVALFMSLRRTMSLKVFDFNQLKKLLTMFIANCLSNSKPISDFCVSVLQQMYDIDIGVDASRGRILSFEYVSQVRPFLTKLASKFTVSDSILLFDALLDHVALCLPDSRCSIVLFSLFLVSRDPKAFMSSKLKFVPKIVRACSSMQRKTDYPIMLYFFRVLDVLATADTTAFYDQFLLADSCEFSNLYLHRFVHSPTYSESIAASLLKQLHDLISFHGQRHSDFVMFPRLILLLKYHVKYFVTESTPEERMASILFGLLMLLSSINNMRVRDIPYVDLLNSLVKVFRVFGDNTGIDLSNGQPIDVSSDELYCQTLANFVSFMHLMSYSLADIFVDKLGLLKNTHHAITACIVSSSLLRLFSSVASEAGKNLSDKILALYLSLLKNESYPDNIVINSVTRASSAFTFQSLLSFTGDNLQKLLVITLDATSNATKSGIEKCMDMLLNIIRAANTQFLSDNASGILKVLRQVIKSKTMELEAIPMLNVIGELTKKVQEATWFLKPDTISFYSLIPLIVNPSPKVSQRALGIFAILIFSQPSGYDPQLLFSSLMSIFVGFEQDTAHYVSMAKHLIEHMTKSDIVTRDHLQILGYVMEPVLAVSDANCNLCTSDFLKFLRTQSHSPDEELATTAMSLMAHFATPKQRVARRS